MPSSSLALPSYSRESTGPHLSQLVSTSLLPAHDPACTQASSILPGRTVSPNTSFLPTILSSCFPTLHNPIFTFHARPTNPVMLTADSQACAGQDLTHFLPPHPILMLPLSQDAARAKLVYFTTAQKHQAPPTGSIPRGTSLRKTFCMPLSSPHTYIHPAHLGWVHLFWAW